MQETYASIFAVIIALRNIFFADLIYGLYDDAYSYWGTLFKFNQVLVRCIDARLNDPDSKKSLARMLYFNLMRNLPNSIMRQLLYKGKLNFGAIQLLAIWTLVVTVIA
jgi:hypothetical protein